MVLSFQSEISIDGVIGITVDKSNVFLVCIRENVKLERTSSSENVLGSAVKQQSFQSEVAPFGASCTATITEPCGDADSNTHNTMAQSKMSFFSSIAAENQNTDLSASVSLVADLTDSKNTTGEINDSCIDTETDNGLMLLPRSFKKKAVQCIDSETVTVESMSSGCKEVVNVKYDATEQDLESPESSPQSDLSVDDSDASDAGTVKMESETVLASSADQHLSDKTADSNDQVGLFN